MMVPLISVLIPAYNHEKYIEETIHSIIGQTYQNVELIVVDDGSEDETWVKIGNTQKECEKRFKRVVFETQQNQGTCITLNRLLSLAQGQYVYLIASDDVAKPDALDRLYDVMKTGKYVLAVGDNEIIDADSKRVSWDKKRNILPYGEGFKSFAEFLQSKKDAVSFNSDHFGSYQSLVLGNYIPNGYMYKKSYIDKIQGYTQEAPLEDWYMNLQLAKCGAFKFVDKVLFSYRWHGGNTILQAQRRHYLVQKTILYEEYLLKQSGDQRFLDIFYDTTQTQKKFFKWSKFMHLYKQKDIRQKKLILKIFNKKLTLWSRNV